MLQLVNVPCGHVLAVARARGPLEHLPCAPPPPPRPPPGPPPPPSGLASPTPTPTQPHLVHHQPLPHLLVQEARVAGLWRPRQQLQRLEHNETRDDGVGGGNCVDDVACHALPGGAAGGWRE